MNIEVWIVGLVVFLQGLFFLHVKTRLKKSIEHEFNVKLKEMEQKFSREMADRERQDKFRLAALDERMKTHQQRAFTLAQLMSHSIHTSFKIRSRVIKDCEAFWESSALYLTDEARRRFREALGHFNMYSVHYNAWKHDRENPEHSKNLERAFNAIQELPAKLISIVDREASGNTDYLKDESITPFGKRVNTNTGEHK